jgi:hypothetical protein
MYSLIKHFLFIYLRKEKQELQSNHVQSFGIQVLADRQNPKLKELVKKRGQA